MFFLIILLPFLGFFCGILFGRYIGKFIIFITILNIFLSCYYSLLLLFMNYKSNGFILLPLSPWITCDELEVSWELLGDNLTFFMCFVVTFIYCVQFSFLESFSF